MSRWRWPAAALFGIAAGTMHFFYVRSLEVKAVGGRQIEVLVSKEKVEAGKIVAEKSLGKRSVPESYLDDRVVRAERSKEIVGLASVVNLEPGQMIEWSDFAERNDPSAENLAELVGPGQRAITIQVNAPLSMGGMLRPGHRVDILGTFERRDQKEDKVAVTLLQNVTVLATGKNTAAAAEGNRYGTVTLSVGLEEAEILSLATTQGSLSLVLRGYDDLEVVSDVPEKGMADVWEAERRNALQKKPQPSISGIERLVTR